MGSFGCESLELVLWALKVWQKICDFWVFCTGPDLWNQKLGSDETFLYSPWGWLYCYNWPKRMCSFGCGSFCLALWALKAWPKLGDFWPFCTGPDLWDQKRVFRRNIDLFSMGLIVLLVHIMRLWFYDCGSLHLSIFAQNSQKSPIFGPHFLGTKGQTKRPAIIKSHSILLVRLIVSLFVWPFEL